MLRRALFRPKSVIRSGKNSQISALFECDFTYFQKKIKFFKFFIFFQIFKKCQIWTSAIKTSPMVPIKWGLMGENAHPPLVCS